MLSQQNFNCLSIAWSQRLPCTHWSTVYAEASKIIHTWKQGLSCASTLEPHSETGTPELEKKGKTNTMINIVNTMESEACCCIAVWHSCVIYEFDSF